MWHMRTFLFQHLWQTRWFWCLNSPICCITQTLTGICDIYFLTHSIFQSLQLLLKLYIRNQCLIRKLVNQGYVKHRLIHLFLTFIGRYQDFVNKYSLSTSQVVYDGLGVYIIGTDGFIIFSTCYSVLLICLCICVTFTT